VKLLADLQIYNKVGIWYRVLSRAKPPRETIYKVMLNGFSQKPQSVGDEKSYRMMVVQPRRVRYFS